MFSLFVQDWKQFGLATAWYNVKFNWAYKHLNATSMKVTHKKGF